MSGSSLPLVVCRRDHVLFRVFGSSLPLVVCRRGHVLFRVFGSSLPLVVCRRGHVLFRVFGSSLPLVACRRGHVLFVFVCVLCCVFLVSFLRLVDLMLPISLDCPFWIAPLVFSNVYIYSMLLEQLTKVVTSVIAFLPHFSIFTIYCRTSPHPEYA